MITAYWQPLTDLASLERLGGPKSAGFRPSRLGFIGLTMKFVKILLKSLQIGPITS